MAKKDKPGLDATDETGEELGEETEGASPAARQARQEFQALVRRAMGLQMLLEPEKKSRQRDIVKTALTMYVQGLERQHAESK